MNRRDVALLWFFLFLLTSLNEKSHVSAFSLFRLQPGHETKMPRQQRRPLGIAKKKIPSDTKVDDTSNQSTTRTVIQDGSPIGITVVMVGGLVWYQFDRQGLLEDMNDTRIEVALCVTASLAAGVERLFRAAKSNRQEKQ